MTTPIDRTAYAQDQAEARFGSSLLIENGDLSLIGGDIAPVHGLANLKQALSLRLLTPYGSDRVNATYGLNASEAFTGSHDKRTVKELIRLETVRTLASDPRVREVSEVLFDDDPRLAEQVSAGGSAAPRSRDRTLRMLVTVETTAETTERLLVDVER